MNYTYSLIREMALALGSGTFLCGKGNGVINIEIKDLDYIVIKWFESINHAAKNEDCLTIVLIYKEKRIKGDINPLNTKFTNGFDHIAEMLMLAIIQKNEEERKKGKKKVFRKPALTELIFVFFLINSFGLFIEILLDSFKGNDVQYLLIFAFISSFACSLLLMSEIKGSKTDKQHNEPIF